MSIPLPKHNNSFEKNIPAIEAVCIQIKSKWDIRIFENSLGALVEIYPLLRSQISPAGNALMILKEAPLRWRWLNSPEAQSQDSHTIDVAKILSEFQVDARARKPWEALIVTHSSSEFSIYLASDAKIADAAKLHAALSLLSEIYKGHGPSSTQRESLAEEKLGALKAAAWDLHAQTPVRDLVCTAASFPLQKNAEPTWQSIPLRLNFQAWVQLKQLGLSMGMPLFTLGAVLLRAALARLGTENQWPIVTKVPGQLPRTLAGSQAGGWQVLQIPYQELDSFQTLLTFAQQTGWHAMPPPKLTPWPSGHWVGVGILPACPSDLEIQVLSTDAGPCDLFWLCPEGASEGYLSWRLGIWHKELLAALGPLLQTLCAQFAENPELLVSHANLQGIISPHWKKWNANSINLPLAQTIPQLFAPMLVRSAGKILIKSQAGTLSFGELDRRSRQLAMLLRKSGIRPGDLVGIALHRSPDILIVLLGILRAGAGYVPLDLSFPTDRLRFMLEDAKAAACICEPGHEDLLPPCSKPLLWNQLKACLNEYLPQEWTDPKQDPRSIAYVIYTSGSTGQPKGVMLSHHSVVNFLLAMQRSPALEASDHVLAVTTLSFDIAVLELLLPILCDSSFYLASAEESLDGATLCQLIQSEAITTMQATPSKFRLMLNAGWQKSSLRKVLCGGEAFPIDVAKRILPLVDELWNMYGPTETTVWSTIHRIEKVDGFIPIGRPIANTGVYILDSLMNPVLPGEKGNLWIGGDGLALGYLHRPELSAEKFRDIQSINERAYNTGDIGRYNWDGILEIFGRSDHQVKLRGYRIELGEIEAAIASFPGISQCLAAVQEFGIDDFRLVAYVCCIAQFDERSLRKAAKDRLPSFMLPAHYMKLDALPLLPNGKIDRKGLPHPLKVAALQPPKAADKINFSQPEVETKNKTLPKIPVTPSQARMLFIEEMDPQTTVHNLVSAWTVQGNLDLAAFKIALEAVIARQEALRMAVAIEESESTLKIFPPFRPYLEIIPNIYKDQKIDAEQNTILEIAHEHIDVSKTPNFRAILIQRSSSEFIFALVTHHIFWDGFSYGIFWKNIQTCYLQALSSKTSTPTNLEINFSQYAIQRQHDLNQPQFIEEMAYWHKTLTPLPEPLELAYDFLRPAELQHKAATAWIPWDKNLDRKLEIFTRAQNCTPFHALLAAYYVLLHRLTGQLDLVIGTPVHGRTQVEHFDIIGNFINVVALRQAFDPKTNFNSLVDQVKRITTEAMAHSELPFEKIVAELKLPRDAARTPLYNTMLFFQDFSLQKIQLGNLQVEGLRLPSINVDTDFVLWVERFTHGTFAGINFRTDLWERESIVSIAGGFRTLLESLLDRPTRNLSDATILTAAEVAKQGVPPQKPLNIDKTTLVTLLLAQAKINSHRPAIIDLHGKHMTWLELEAKSLSLALSLQKIAVKPGDIVGVCLSRSPDLIVVLLAILRAGAAYLPLDPQYPRDRLNYMISDSGAKLILTESTYLDQLQGNTTEIKCLDRDALLFNHEAKQGYILQAPLPEDLAYLIYTSGSTGLPKAVEIQHAAVVTFLKGFQTAVALPKNMRTLALTTISFDISVLEIFGTLAWGGTIILVGQDQSNEAMPIISALKEHDINLLQATPATYHLLLAAGWQGHPDLTLLCGGEALTKNLARSLLARSKALWNVYGPTEATVWAVAAKIVDSEKPITIGKVLPGYEAYILDEQRRPIPQGTIGTLFLGGSALALAYRHRPDLTEERFIAHPLRPESKIYDTGDLCRFRSDGTIEYISRKDNQIKLRGYRIELGEIEAAIAKHPQVTQAVVVVKKDQEDDHRLIAYCTIKAGSNLSFADLLAVLRPQLPGYMLHNKLVVLDQFKLTGSGKVDKKQLPHPSDEGLVKSEIIPKVGIETKLTPEEQSLATIWREMIGVQRVDRLDNFFDLGGHSLLALKVLHRCHQDLGAKFKVRDLLMLNLAQLAHQLPASTSGSSSGKKGGL